jgi:hypothetical protein
VFTPFFVAAGFSRRMYPLGKWIAFLLKTAQTKVCGYIIAQFINSASKHCNDVILSDAKNLAFSCCYEILHGACPELNDEILRCAQNDRAKGSG